ncbi:hypothetical protein EIN_097220 [Entamoeba invadens IP1]|uniref:Uncharacterized protein n=1 Tax=Entamoeba invadens IP1 TaxID=370355 RepID=A0A0A1U0M9_ENTIV|nr:hypothetical protein EIN_097220 [Entamoeba invadens IP1]ELP87455.1 hypothetical protein EIN_097220 [Entamoeba invadens IP1]|eukprot:XP_004254226.1 hypothetical protein EIN_097220 [Entamoeba invadens IP1]
MTQMTFTGPTTALTPVPYMCSYTFEIPSSEESFSDILDILMDIIKQFSKYIRGFTDITTKSYEFIMNFFKNTWVGKKIFSLLRQMVGFYDIFVDIENLKKDEQLNEDIEELKLRTLFLKIKIIQWKKTIWDKGVVSLFAELNYKNLENRAKKTVLEASQKIAGFVNSFFKK